MVVAHEMLLRDAFYALVLDEIRAAVTSQPPKQP